MSWTSIRANPPATGSTLFVRSEGSLFFAAYSKWQDKWFQQHNGTETECEAPQFWWDDDQKAVDKLSVITEKQGQLTFF